MTIQTHTTVHPDQTAWRAVDACGGTYTPEEDSSGFSRGHLTAITDALKAVQPVDALMREMLEALRAADEALAQFTTFEDDCRYIMGNTNFEIVKTRRDQIKAAITKATEGAEATSASSVGTNGEAVREQKPVVTELVERLKVGDAVRHVHMGVRGIIRTHVEGWWGVEWSDQSVAVCRPSVLAALSRQAQTGNGEGGA